MTPQSVRNLGVYGVIRQAEVDDALIPDGAVTEAVNVHFDRKGVATVRPGVVSLGGTNVITFGNTNPCIGLHNVQSSLLLAAFGVFGTKQSVKIYRLSTDTNTWVDDATLTGVNFALGTAKVRFCDFANSTLALSGLGNSVNATFHYDRQNGSDLTNGGPDQNFIFQFPSTSVDVVATSTLSEVYKSRMYLAGTFSYPNRLWFSNVIAADNSVNWTPTSDFVDINPGDGEKISSIKRYSLELLVFKPNYIYRFRTSGLDPDPLIKIGTRSHESVVEGKRGLYFHNDSGFFRYAGSYPEEISRAISDIVLAIPTTQYQSIVGWKDEDHIYWSLGNITIQEASKQTTIKNCVVRYTESSDVWTIYSYPWDVRRAVTYITNAQSSMSIALGLDNGSVATLNRGTTDIGEPIAYRLITKWYEWDGIENRKNIQLIVSLAEKGMGASLMYQVNDEQSDWKGFNKDLRDPVSIFDSLSIKYNRIRFKISGVTTNEAPVFRGLEIPLGTNEGFIKQWPKS